MRRLLPAIMMSIATVATGIWLWYAVVTMPHMVALPLDAPQVVGIWGREDTGAWSNGHTHMTVNALANLPWRRVSWMWRQPAGTPLHATISTPAHTLAVTQTVPEWRTVHLLIPAHTTHVIIQSTTMRVAGDRRDLGPLLYAPKVTALATPPWYAGAFSLDLWLPCIAVLCWVWRGRWWGVFACASIMSVYGALVWLESRNGLQHTTLWLDATGRYVSTVLIGVWAWRSRYRQIAEAPAQGRRLGLDIMRAIAVLCVVFAHFTPLMFVEWSRTADLYRWTLYLGAVGVDIFFALSGYLIGGILWRVLPTIHERTVLHRFWVRRWLRTLPAAYVSAVVIWVVAAPQHVDQYLASILMVGNFNPWLPSSENAQWWSLSAEELFYLIFPLLLYYAARRWPTQALFIGTLGVFTGIMVLVRLWMLWFLPLAVVGNIEIVSYARLDSMVWGVLLLWMRRQHPARFMQLAQLGYAPGVVVMSAGIMLMLDNTRWYYVALALGHTLITAGAALLIPAFEYVHTTGWKRLDAVCVWIALVSYSAYLYHPMMEQFLLRRFGMATSWQMLIGLLVAYLGLTFASAWLSYRVVELPVLRWRDQRYPDTSAG